MLWFSAWVHSSVEVREFKNHIVSKHVPKPECWFSAGHFLVLDWSDFRCPKQQRIRDESQHSGAITERPLICQRYFIATLVCCTHTSVICFLADKTCSLDCASVRTPLLMDISQTHPKTLFVGIRVFFSLGWESIVVGYTSRQHGVSYRCKVGHLSRKPKWMSG